ncbi:hypothetical protein CROQUDRAFT_670747 [Cronartium quercuum f. sp. fusiforme G11]|uniref:Uncharacterized protein n=1 Tax=Cronartium quercuum f. sp. fusiforme G11 TaxID=708437 RepID=A0A9P6NJC7_9BASI|nr:hypothetical protein CROQUDRAFT_670747 [Cronartium quercuum f. sp. fusiforme G11]
MAYNEIRDGKGMTNYDKMAGAFPGTRKNEKLKFPDKNIEEERIEKVPEKETDKAINLAIEIIRWITEILATKGKIKELESWLRDQFGIELHFPDLGSSWNDGIITSSIIRMYKERNELEKMITFYHAATEPSFKMLERSLNENHKFHYSIVPTRVFHDLIHASVKSNKPHLALHFLTEAINKSESELKLKPLIGHRLRLQPDTFNLLIKYLSRKRRDTQLLTLQTLVNRLLQINLIELEQFPKEFINKIKSDSVEELESLIYRPFKPESDQDLINFERCTFLIRSIKYTLIIRNRLNKLINNANQVRSIRWGLSHLNNLIKESKNGSSPKIKRTQDRILKLIDQRSLCVPRNRGRNVFGRVERRDWGRVSET